MVVAALFEADGKGSLDVMIVSGSTSPAHAEARIVVHLMRFGLDGCGPVRPASRRILRAHLATLLGCSPHDVPLRVDADGRPHLAEGDLQFSLSHSEGWLAIATSRDCRVGVDVEAIRPLPGVDAVVEHFLPPRGRAEVLAAASADRTTVFLRWWTRIEAAAKASGHGLDAARAALAAAPQVSCDAAPGLALAAAAAIRGGVPAVEWRLPGGAR